MEELRYNAHLDERAAREPKCHKCSKSALETDLVECSSMRCDRHVCADCANEVEWELEACREHALGVLIDMRETHRAALRRLAERRAA